MLYLPNGYKPKLGLKQTQKAIKIIKDAFQRELSTRLNLDRITAPIMVKEGNGLNDDLSGVERKVSFSVKALNEDKVEIVQSLAKWKRMALYEYGYLPGEGIYTDMNAIRRDDDMDSTHSIFVDQWDWELIIDASQRCEDFLRQTVEKIVDAIVSVKEMVNDRFDSLEYSFERKVFFISAEELREMYPDLSPSERENAITKTHKTVFVTKIGAYLSDGVKHSLRAPDYDDWELNGDLLMWDETLGAALEISSMGIRVNAESLDRQLTLDGKNDRRKHKYHSLVLNGTLPLTIGGGIGQSRICMLMLEKAHIGEVQVSVWPDDMLLVCKENGINIL